MPLTKKKSTKKTCNLLQVESKCNEVYWELPLVVLSESNVKEHWSKKYKRSMVQKKMIATAASLTLDKIKLPCCITLTRIAPRKLDEDNLVNAFKSIKDYVADMIIPGKAPGRADGDPRLNWFYAQEKGEPKTYGVKIVIKLAVNNNGC